MKSFAKSSSSISREDIEYLEDLTELEYEYVEDCEERFDECSKANLRVKECKRILDKKVLTAELNRKNKSIGSDIEVPDDYKDKYCIQYLEERIEDLYEQLGGIDEEDENEEEILLGKLKATGTFDQEEFEDVESELADLRKKLAILRRSEGAQMAIDQWNAIQEKIKTVTQSLDKCQKEQTIVDKTLEAIAILKTKQREAEILSMQNVINSINTIACNYLEMFFDESISVSITMIKRTRNNTKMSLEIMALYKGHKYSDINDFSQGEKIKINLAFILALNQINNSPFLLLDEFMGNIDTGVIYEIYDTLKNISQDKPIFVVDHHSVQGIFDKIIKFE